MFAFWAVIMFFGAAECGLRVAGALYLDAYRDRVADGIASDGAAQLWAFGDSFTFGIGAEDPAQDSYPAVAARIASVDRNEQVSLVNLARPGLNSTEVVAELEQALLERRPGPAAVLFLSGVNNWRWLGQSGFFCLDDGDADREQGGWLDSVRVYRVLRWAVLKGRPPRESDRRCRLVGEGFQHLEIGRPDLALYAFEDVAGDGGGGWADVGRGLAHSRMGQLTDAVQAYESATEGLPDNPALNLALAWARRLTGDTRGAEELLATAQLGTDYVDEIACLRGWLAFDEGRLDEAERLFLRAGHLDRKVGPPSGAAIVPFALDGLGWVAFARGDPLQALARFDECNQIGGELHVTPHWLGWCHIGAAIVHADADRGEEALEALKVARADSAAAAASHALEGWLVAAGPRGCKGASHQWSSAIGRVPGHSWAEEGRARCETAEGIGSLDELWTAQPLRPLSVPVVAQWLDPGDTRLLEADIVRAAELARGVGAPLYLLQYPQPEAHPEIAAAIVRAGAAAGVPVIDPRPRLKAALDSGAAWNELFIDDGHPTTRGYKIVGEEVGRHLRGAPAPGQ